MEPGAQTQVDALPDPSKAGDSLRLCYAANPLEAELIRSRLAAEGIPAFAQDVATWQMIWYIGPAIAPRGVPVVVCRKNLDRARRILAELKAEQAEPPQRGEQIPPIAGAAEDEPIETAEEAHVRRGFWAAVMFFFSPLGALLFIYSSWLLWRGRSAWDHPDPQARRRCRRRMVMAIMLNVAMLKLVVMVISMLLESTEYAPPFDWQPLENPPVNAPLS